MNHDLTCDALDVEIEQFARRYEDAPLDFPVPTCPGWTIRALAEHLGTVHRWAARMVASTASTRLSFRELDVGEPPFDATWLREGGAELLAALRAVDPLAPMWAWGVDQHARYWSRRQLHETVVHRVDLEGALGRASTVPLDVAQDGVDELLTNLRAAAVFSPKVRELKGRGEVVAFETANAERRWRVALNEDGVGLLEDDGPADATLGGPADELLLVLYRRRTREKSSLRVSGDGVLVDYWLEHCALE